MGGVFGCYSHSILSTSAGVQNVLGWYVFVDYVLIISAYRIHNTEPMLSLSSTASKRLDFFEILTGVSWCLGLQGGQLLLICGMLGFVGHRGSLFQGRGEKMRPIFSNMNFMFVGIWATTSAIILLANNISCTVSHRLHS